MKKEVKSVKDSELKVKNIQRKHLEGLAPYVTSVKKLRELTGVGDKKFDNRPFGFSLAHVKTLVEESKIRTDFEVFYKSLSEHKRFLMGLELERMDILIAMDFDENFKAKYMLVGKSEAVFRYGEVAHELMKSLLENDEVLVDGKVYKMVDLTETVSSHIEAKIQKASEDSAIEKKLFKMYRGLKIPRREKLDEFLGFLDLKIEQIGDSREDSTLAIFGVRDSLDRLERLERVFDIIQKDPVETDLVDKKLEVLCSSDCGVRHPYFIDCVKALEYLDIEIEFIDDDCIKVITTLRGLDIVGEALRNVNFKIIAMAK